jgi:alanine racemase
VILDAHLVWAEIDLEAVAHNVRELRRRTHPTAKLMAVVKADAYGHGAVEVARTALCNGAEWLGVARVEEAVALRKAGLDAPILVFGYTLVSAVNHLTHYDIAQTVYSVSAAESYAEAARSMGKTLTVHIKIDTGMGRQGLLTDCSESDKAPAGYAERSVKAVERIANIPGIYPEGIWTHFATADSADKTYAVRQLSLFLDFLERLEKAGLHIPIRHAANSAATIEMPESHLDMVRPGISLYGLYPSEETDRSLVHLKPAMMMKSRIIFLKQVPEGFNISYGKTYRTKHSTTIATVPVGYADGFRRLLSSKGEMLVRGRRAPVVGRVCMDLTMIDVGHIPAVEVGDEVVIFGKQRGEEIHADELARLLGTINYEVVSSLTARVPKVHLPKKPFT